MQDDEAIEQDIVARYAQSNLGPSFAVDGRRIKKLFELENGIPATLSAEVLQLKCLALG